MKHFIRATKATITMEIFIFVGLVIVKWQGVNFFEANNSDETRLSDLFFVVGGFLTFVITVVISWFLGIINEHKKD